MSKKIALVLSGGGAKGAFQVGAEKYAREVKGYHWDIIAGVSVGALNATMLAMQKYTRLFEIWNTMSNNQVYTGGINIFSTIKLLFGSKSFYGNEPLQRKLIEEFDQSAIQSDLRVGAVSLTTGEYVEFRAYDPDLEKAVIASTTMPIIWTPVDISENYPCMVDGGVRNITPIGDVLDAEPDEIVIINCNPQEAHPVKKPIKNIIDIGGRTLDLLLNEIFQSDMREFLMINQLVKSASDQGVTLYHPTNGRPLRAIECKIIEPDEALGDTLDFSQASIRKSLLAGMEKARHVLSGVKRSQNH